MPNAVIYRRYSTDEQEHGSGDTLARQAERCSAMAEARGWTVVETLTDRGKSAFKGEHLRDGELGAFEAKVRAGEVAPGTVLLVERLDRLSRRPVPEVMAWIHAMTTFGITVAVADVDEVYGASVDLGTFLTTAIRAATGHEESRKKSEQTLKARERLWRLAETKTGPWANLAGKIPGWLVRRPDASGFDVIEERAAIVREVYELSADGLGVITIANLLNQRGLKPFAAPTVYEGRPYQWSRSGVRQLLTSTTVEGDFRPHSGPYAGRIITEFYPRVVDADVVARARANLASRATVKGQGARQGTTNLFAGLMKCGECGRRAFLTSGVKKGRRYSYVKCEAAQEGRCSNRAGYAYPAFERSTLDLIIDLALDDRVFAATGELKAARVRVAEVEKAIETKAAARARLLSLFAAGDDQLADMIAQAKADLDALNAELETAKLEVARASGQVSGIEHLKRVNDIRAAAMSEDANEREQARGRLRVALSTIVMAVDIEPVEGRKVFTVILKGGVMAFRIDDRGNLVKALSDAAGQPLWAFLPPEAQNDLRPLIDRIEKLSAA
ncbi:recombinase family protein [Brevundimonas sp. 2R-24]|uniref:Recombinase family protein n=1 Tax=Peiella sedimenti TaxID=3061083 RepID=A0ABT8SQ37_9CAUL|nr:recombinase family protein [Caulobacteraceae bacterium XZ-24]